MANKTKKIILKRPGRDRDRISRPGFQETRQTALRQSEQAGIESHLVLTDLKRGVIPPKWAIRNSLKQGELGVITGPEGVDNGQTALQLVVDLAAGRPPLGGFETDCRGRKVLYVSAEDSEEELNNKFNYIFKKLPLSAEDKENVAENILRVPMKGHVSLCRSTAEGVTATDNIFVLKGWIKRFRPDVVVLDNLASFISVNENSNAQIRAAYDLIREKIIAKHGCNVIINHHPIKDDGKQVESRRALECRLNQISSRGAAVTAAAKWVLVLVPLSESAAIEIFGRDAFGKPSGGYIAGQVVKNKFAPKGKIFYQKRGRHGVLANASPTSPVPSKEDLIRLDAILITNEAARCEKAGEGRLPLTKCGRNVGIYGKTRTKLAAEFAVAQRWIRVSKRLKGKGYEVVFLKSPDEEPSDSYFDDEEFYDTDPTSTLRRGGRSLDEI